MKCINYYSAIFSSPTGAVFYCPSDQDIWARVGEKDC